MTKEWILTPSYSTDGEPVAYPWPFSPFTKKLDDILKSQGFTPNIKFFDNTETGLYTLNRMYGSRTSPIVISYFQEIVDASFDADDGGNLPLSDMVGINSNHEHGEIYLPREVLLQRFSEEDYGREFIEFVIADKELQKRLVFPEYAENMYREESSAINYFNDLDTDRLQFGRHLHEKKNGLGFYEKSYTGLYSLFLPQNGKTGAEEILEHAEKIVKSNKLSN